jgi:hypothetical protein
MRTLLRCLFLSLTILLTGLLASSCATSSKGPPKKPYEFCYCGALKGPDNKNYCGIWADRKKLDVPHNALGTQEQGSCTPQDCSKLYSSQCESMQMWAYPAVEYPKPSPTPCYCDASLVENDKGQITLVCAAWMNDSKNLLEYYVTKECNTTTCGSAPFQVAQKLCPAGFRSHYLPFPKTSTPPMPIR